jgi:Asp-tRNA(Asn)/Glu-tRNA(Gln) amidotransferase C subunit
VLRPSRADVSSLTTDHVAALAAALGLQISSEDLLEVTHRLNAVIEVLEPLAALQLETVEPTPGLSDEPIAS